MQITDNQINRVVIAAFKLRKKSTCDEVKRSILKKFVNTIFDEFWYVPNLFTFTYQCKLEDVSNHTNCIIETITELFNSVGLDVSVNDSGWKYYIDNISSTDIYVYVEFKIVGTTFKTIG